MFYRLYFIDDERQPIEAFDLDCADDDAAIREAIKVQAERADNAAAELWRGSRLVHAIKQPLDPFA